ncbi:hydrogenase [Sagittula sp. P11]|uniref:HypC/HybG/HupF family hydrogenase formation chaperone n=1 Tax=unclassified Sagittula TaxID=2624628 RepID=UPI000C2D0EF8|nr:HypC/HybG/HupF family hydrogenase formation chaperone [Sagittula sp. P11]AUC54511.1 hydrogenase [Sagittula sp. P11]
MCVGVPMEILSVDGISAMASGAEGIEVIDLSLTPDATVGCHVLTFLGAAREIITADEAAKIASALAGLRSLMNGGALGDAFADLEDTGPRLPPHLQAALAAGKTTA